MGITTKDLVENLIFHLFFLISYQTVNLKSYTLINIHEFKTLTICQKILKSYSHRPLLPLHICPLQSGHASTTS